MAVSQQIRFNTHHKRARRSVMNTTGALCLLVGMMVAHDSSAFVQQTLSHNQPSISSSSSHSRDVHIPLHASNAAADSHNGGTSSHSNHNGNSGALALPVELQEEFERKNTARVKFGLKPITVQQFLDIQSEVNAMEQELVFKERELMAIREEQERQSNSLGKIAKNIFQNALEDTCLTNFDCESPKVCCDLGVKKMCCSNGMLQVRHEYILEQVRINVNDE